MRDVNKRLSLTKDKASSNYHALDLFNFETVFLSWFSQTNGGADKALAWRSEVLRARSKLVN